MRVWAPPLVTVYFSFSRRRCETRQLLEFQTCAKVFGLLSASVPPTPALIALDRGRPDCEGKRINITILQHLFFHTRLCIQMDLCGGEVIASNMWLTILTLRETAALACSQLNGYPSGRVIFSTSAMLFSSHTALREIWLGSVQSFSLSPAHHCCSDSSLFSPRPVKPLKSCKVIPLSSSS